MDPSREQIEEVVCPDKGTGNEATHASKPDPPPGTVVPMAAAAPTGVDEPQIIAWVKLAQQGDDGAFENLVCHFQDRVWRRALYRLKDWDETYDLSQEVFLICFRKIQQFRGESKFWTWLSRIIDNQVKNRHAWLQRRGKGRTFSLDAGLGGDDSSTLAWDPAETGPGPRRQAQGREAMESLLKNLAQMSEDHREILMLRFSDELSYEEIAETLEISLGTVKSRINRGRSELRTLMKDHLD